MTASKQPERPDPQPARMFGLEVPQDALAPVVHRALARAWEAVCAPSHASQPYKNDYAAAKVLQATARQLQTPSAHPTAGRSTLLSSTQAAAEQGDDTQPSEQQQQGHNATGSAALLSVLRGIVLLETDQQREGEKSILASMDGLSALADARLCAAATVRAYNALGCLYFNRAAYEEALSAFNKASDVYTAHVSCSNNAASSKEAAVPDAAAAVAAAAAATSSCDEGPALAQMHTKTLFYMAQCHATCHRPAEAALFCTMTLSRQLAAGEADPAEWCDSCTHLAAFFAQHELWGAAEYCMLAAQAVADKAGSSGGLVPGDARATLDRRWAKMCRDMLRLSYKRLGAAGSRAVSASAAPNAVTARALTQLKFDSLELPAVSDLLESGSLRPVKAFPAARDLFNKGLPRYRAALQHFQLEGWVSEHVEIKQEISSMYLYLAAFEEDPQRKCAMHRQRMKELEPLVGQLNPEVYTGLVRGIDLEVAAASLCILEVKEEARNGSRAKVAAAAQAAAAAFERFLAWYEVDGQLPRKLAKEDEDMLLGTCFTLGRFLHRVEPETDGVKVVQAVRRALQRLQWAADYVRHNQVAARMEEACLAQELVGLLEAKLARLQLGLARQRPSGPAAAGQPALAAS